MEGYKAQLLHKADYKATEWSGGMTTEIAIAPEGSIYADRDFLWRLSSATVELEESDFTSLPDYNRIIMTLKGGIKLSHNKGEWLELPEFVPHSFDGGDETASVGKVIDFNLMMRKGKCQGEVVPIQLEKGGKGQGTDLLGGVEKEFDTMMIYCFTGSMAVIMETGERYLLESGDTLKIEGIITNKVWSYEALEETAAVWSAVSGV